MTRISKLFVSFVVALSVGCCTYPGESYIAQDEATYKWAAPKLMDWAEQTDDPEWAEAVYIKLQSWEARWKKGKEVGEAKSGE